MRLHVDLDHLLAQNRDPKKTAKQIELMRKENMNVTLRVRRAETIEVFKHLPGGQQPWRSLLNWMLEPRGMFASLGIITYGMLAFWMF